jgi:hypothetical protein
MAIELNVDGSLALGLTKSWVLRLVRSLRRNAREVGTATVAGFHPALMRGPLRELEAEVEHPQYLA